MEIRGTRVLLLGGSGLVGTAIARQILPHGPAALVVSALTEREVEAAVAELRDEPTAQGVEIVPEWGDVFLPESLRTRSRGEILGDPEARRILLDNLYGGGAEERVERSTLGALLLRNRPDIVVDCVNTATIFAYQNIFSSVADLRERASEGTLSLESVERHLATLYLPQLISHVRVALDSLRRVGTKMYLKIGTSGTGGMGLNIPFTHSEERPSRVLLAKASLAGAHTNLLFLMARTPGAPAVKEIKPTAAISWKRIGAGQILRDGRPIQCVDATGPLPIEIAFRNDVDGWVDAGSPLEGVYLDAGENGLFSPPEFEALTALGLMEYITPEEIAQDVEREIRGYPTGHDVVAALDASSSGPTYRAGVLRQSALTHMELLESEQGLRSIAYEMLGPPRLSKLLFEAAILKTLFHDDLLGATKLDPAETATKAESLLSDDRDLRIRILSIGLAILVPGGDRILRGAVVKVTPEQAGTTAVNRLAEQGWVDLRASNWARWRERLRQIVAGIGAMRGIESGSASDLEPWHALRQIRPGALAAWVFRHEDGGERTRR
jgi:NAD(P)-dependent dehydrogenase (short-subunit alcohol dehydrogenase family)